MEEGHRNNNCQEISLFLLPNRSHPKQFIDGRKQDFSVSNPLNLLMGLLLSSSFVNMWGRGLICTLNF